jgi:hypothetical protein
MEQCLHGAQRPIEEGGFTFENASNVKPDRFNQPDNKSEKNYVFQPAHYRDSDREEL